jgi:hypothetical protein
MLRVTGSLVILTLVFIGGFTLGNSQIKVITNTVYELQDPLRCEDFTSDVIEILDRAYYTSEEQAPDCSIPSDINIRLKEYRIHGK